MVSLATDDKGQAVQFLHSQPLSRRVVHTAPRVPALALCPNVAFATLPAQDNGAAANQLLGPLTALRLCERQT